MKLSVHAVAFAFLSIHLIMAAVIPVFDDEAYYALWARYPSAGYYDHPPMIAYLIRSGTFLFGETGFGIRLLPVLGMGVATLLVGDTTRLLGGTREQAGLAALVFNLGLLIMGVGAFATPDVPSTLFWIAGLWAALRAVTSGKCGWWIATGLFLGLGGLSKFTNVFIAVGLLGWLVSTRQGRVHLRTWRPYVAILAAVLPLLPYLAWNLSHDWLGFERQASRLTQGAVTGRYVVEYLVVFILLPTPLVTWFAGRAVWRRLGHQTSLVLWSVAPLLVYFLNHATHASVQANWLTPVQGTITALAALALGGRPGWTRATWISGAVMTFGLLGAAFNPWQPVGQVDNPPNQTRGWTQTRADLGEALTAQGAVWIATTDYARTAMLSYQFPDVPVWDMTMRQRYLFQGDFPPALCSEPGLLVETLPAPPESAATLFGDLGPATIVTRQSGGVELARYRVRRVSDPTVAGLCHD